MKKFLTSLFILAVFGGFVFYLGWTQFKIKPEFIGVVISKTNGIDKTPVENGKFSWHKQFLLPTNAVLKSFSIKPVNVNKTISGSMPNYANDNFSYSFDFTISLTVAPEVIPQLLEENKISDSQDLNSYLVNAADTIAQLAAEYMIRKYQENRNFRPESVRRDDLLRNIMIYKEFPEIDLSVFAVTKSNISVYNSVEENKYELPEEENFEAEGEEL